MTLRALGAWRKWRKSRQTSWGRGKESFHRVQSQSAGIDSHQLKDLFRTWSKENIKADVYFSWWGKTCVGTQLLISERPWSFQESFVHNCWSEGDISCWICGQAPESDKYLLPYWRARLTLWEARSLWGSNQMKMQVLGLDPGTLEVPHSIWNLNR